MSTLVWATRFPGWLCLLLALGLVLPPAQRLAHIQVQFLLPGPTPLALWGKQGVCICSEETQSRWSLLGGAGSGIFQGRATQSVTVGQSEEKSHTQPVSRFPPAPFR